MYGCFRGGSFQPLTHLSASDDFELWDLRLGRHGDLAQDFGCGLRCPHNASNCQCVQFNKILDGYLRLRKNDCTKSMQRAARIPLVTSTR
jgi:hypothetical protein